MAYAKKYSHIGVKINKKGRGNSLTRMAQTGFLVRFQLNNVI